MSDENQLPTDLTVTAQSPREALFLQAAQAYYQEMQTVGENAPYGQMFNQVDAFAFQNIRELGRQSLELIVQEQVDIVQKKRKRKPYLRKM